MDILTALKDGVSNIVRKSAPLAPRSILPRPKGRGLPSIWINFTFSVYAWPVAMFTRVYVIHLSLPLEKY